jgi:quercetin dioxygenase-like cupin family protein
MTTSARGPRLFRRADAVDLADTTVMSKPVMEPLPDREALAEITTTSGYINQVLFGDPESGGMSLIRLWYAPHYALPRHSHDVDCLYYVVAGEAHLGNQVLSAGDGFFVPAGAPYAYTAGPEGVEVLEFRATSQFGIHVTERPARWAQLANLAREHREQWAAQTAAQTTAAR